MKLREPERSSVYTNQRMDRNDRTGLSRHRFPRYGHKWPKKSRFASTSIELVWGCYCLASANGLLVSYRSDTNVLTENSHLPSKLTSMSTFI